MIKVIFVTNPLFFSSNRQTSEFNHIGLLIGDLLTLTQPINVKKVIDIDTFGIVSKRQI